MKTTAFRGLLKSEVVGGILWKQCW